MLVQPRDRLIPGHGHINSNLMGEGVMLKNISLEHLQGMLVAVNQTLIKYLPCEPQDTPGSEGDCPLCDKASDFADEMSIPLRCHACPWGLIDGRRCHGVPTNDIHWSYQTITDRRSRLNRWVTAISEELDHRISK